MKTAKLSPRAKATLALVGAAVAAGVAVSGGTGGLDVARTGSSTVATRAATPLAAPAAEVAAAPVSAAAAAVPGPTTAPVAWGDDPGRVELVLDSSRSMRTPTTGSSTRMDEARRALTGAVATLPKDAQVGLRVYGSSVPVQDPLRPSAAACRDSRQVLPIAGLDPARLDAVVAAFAPYGYTPTSYALEQAARDLGTTGRRTIVLVSDGEESCGADPAATAQRLRQSGIDVQTVGLHASPAAATQLQHVAAAGGGTYTGASSSSELQSGLQHILDRMRAGSTGASAGASAGANGPAPDVPVGAAAVGQPGDPAPAAAHQARATSGDSRALPAGFVTAFLFLLLFFWLKDHR